MKRSITLLSTPGTQSGDAADTAYQHIFRRIRGAEHSLEIHMYVWRADEVGHLIGQAVLDAAERGVAVKIFKDSGARLFESQESNRRPFFPSPQPWTRRLVQKMIGLTFPNSFVADEWDQSLGAKLMAHPNVSFQWVSPTHTKYYCIDETFLITGSLNLEDRHRGYHDIMVEVSGAGNIRDFREARGMVLMNRPEKDTFPIKSAVLALIENACESIHIEMAYVGDADITRALIAAGRRGVKISILFSAKANIGNDVNFHTLREIMEQTEIDVRLSEKMIHSKVMIVDQKKALLGSANFSIFSMEKAGELCLLTEESEFLEQLLVITGERWLLGRPVKEARELPKYNRTLARLQQWHQRNSSHE